MAHDKVRQRFMSKSDGKGPKSRAFFSFQRTRPAFRIRHAFLFFVEPGDLLQLATTSKARLLSEAWRGEAMGIWRTALARRLASLRRSFS